MYKKGDLQGQTIVFTSLPKSDESINLVKQLSGDMAFFPLLDINEVLKQDDEFISKLHSYDWLIFTSQNAVEMFHLKLNRSGILASKLSLKVAAVGTKTATALEKMGLQVSFIPTIFSADTFIKEFPGYLKVGNRSLFLKGSLAKRTISEGIEHVDEWTVYQTIANLKNADELTVFLQENPAVFITFASPSAVNIFSQYVLSQVNSSTLKFAAIGHVTANCLEEYGLPVHVQAKPYTYLSLVEEIVKWKDADYNERSTI
jgi:uroporphyrinogen-III synthase